MRLFKVPRPFLLDTNAYFLLFSKAKSEAYHRLEEKLSDGSGLSFFISEITSLEIHSVLGKYRRGAPRQSQSCDRIVLLPDGKNLKCPNKWLFEGRKKLTVKVFRYLRKMILDVESRKGEIRATILMNGSEPIDRARQLLIKYADKYRFGSHDAIIAGTFIMARKKVGIDLTLVTSDKGFKSVLLEESLPFYDPHDD